MRALSTPLFRCAVAFCVALLCTGAARAQADAAATQQANALFDEAWEATMQRHPEWATELGDNRYGDRLFDASPEAEKAEYASLRALLAKAKSSTPESTRSAGAGSGRSTT